ncbi:hypothetical protein NNL21_26060 [Paenibacillus mendelii]|uniref:DUF4352 domain-containing protein n=1 Tax=Paenibacillus mendelii TaxID=206163 RepID=A0ABV6JA98_9BACL|nr:hypothetical protein [Paenibacillus mendelii]
MNQKAPAFTKISIFVMVLSLTACSGATEPSAGPETLSPTNEAVTAPAIENEQAPAATRAQSETFDLMTGEGNQSHTAALHQGEGFSLYVFEKFSFDTAKGRLSLSSNPEYYVDIESLPANYDLTQLETAGKEELEELGEVSDFSGELVEHPLGSAELYLHLPLDRLEASWTRFE